jgi:hypothetical protein
VDGSGQSFEAVRYASQVLPPEKTKVVLFHVQSEIPKSFWDIEKDPSLTTAMIVLLWAAGVSREWQNSSWGGLAAK